MGAQEKQDADEALRRLEALIEALETHPDPAAGATARELVGLVIELHGLGLARLMAILAPAKEGATILARLAEDEHVRAMLLLHGLHPEDLETRVRRAAQKLRPHLGVHGLRLEVVEVANGAVRLRLHGAGAGIAAPLLWSLPREIEDVVFEAAPDAETVTIEGLDFASVTGAACAAE
ncbi:MAG: hypothetical protein ACLPPF_08765 [Rhodomicrobium sp.]